MFSFLCKKQLFITASNVRVLGIPPKLLELPHNASSLIRLFSTVKSESPEILNDEQQSVTLSYLINSCGLSSKAANVASKKISLKSPEKPNLVLATLRNHGLSDAHIIKMMAKYPIILLACPEKTILPKLEFFHSIGMPASVLAQIISDSPDILKCSLEKCIIPFYECLKNLLQDDEKVFTVFKRTAAYNMQSALRYIPSNIAFLRNFGVSKSNISFLVVNHHQPLTMRSDGLVDLVDKVIESGIDISKLIFVEAIRVLHGMSKSVWESKKEVYGRWGWSESDIQRAFSIHPACMSLSEKKITSMMEFLVHEMNCEPKTMARHPAVLLFSLEKRIMPRCRVYKLLRFRGLIKQSYALLSLLVPSDKKFLERFVAKHEHLPHILDVYSGKLDLSDLGFTSTELANFKLL